MATERHDDEPLLAVRAGRYREFAPSPALGAHFQCLWAHDVDATVPRAVAIVPDGYCDLIWLGRQLFVTGPDRTAAFPHIPAGARIIGARFAPGAASAWLRLPLSEIVGQSVPLADIGMPGMRGIEARLEDCAYSTMRLPLFRRLLENAAQERDLPAREGRLIFDAMSDTTNTNRISALRQTLDISESQFRRRCHHYFGYGAKTLERIRRFQRFMSLCRNAPATSLAEIALDAGFSDQAHMTREVGALSTLTPAAMLSQLRAV